MNTEPFLGEIALWSGMKIPKGWALCDGTLLSVPQNNMLFSLLGVTFGGDGVNTFGLPDLRGRTVVGSGLGPFSSAPYDTGVRGGQEVVVLSPDQLPAHNHLVGATDAVGTHKEMTDAIPATVAGSTNKYFSGAPDVAIDPAALAPAGGAGAHDNIQPFLSMTYLIAVEGLYPS